MLYSNSDEVIKTCMLCKSEIDINKHLNGLVIADRHFLCEDCCVNTERAVLFRFVKENSGDIGPRPIMRWLTEKGLS